MRKTSLDMVHELARRDPRVVFIGSDLGAGTLTAMRDEFPDRYFMEGIAEQNIIGLAAGLAMDGFIPYINTIATFFTRRCLEQVAVDLCLHKLPVRMIASGGGLVYAPLGPTHCAIEDVGLMRALPNMTVLCPEDGIEVEKMMDCVLNWPGPIYIRINRNDLPLITPDQPYSIGKVTMHRDGKDAVIFAAGIMVSRALMAADALSKEGISVRVVNVSTIKPLDRNAIIQYASGVDAIVTAEEGSIIGGLGSAVVEALRGVSHAPVEFVGVNDSFGISAEGYDELLTHFALTSDAVANALLTLLKGSKTCA